MKAHLVLPAVLLAFAGCTSFSEIEREPVAAAFVREVPAERLGQSTSTITVRTVVPNEKGITHDKEVIGARCTLRSDDIKAEIITPQAVIVPTYKQRRAFKNRGVPSAIAIRCKGDGVSGAGIITAREKSATTAIGGGVGAAIVSTVVTASIASSTPWKYDANAYVTLKP